MTVARVPHVRRVGVLLIIGSLAAIALATLLPEPMGPIGSPFCLMCGPFGAVNAALNVLLFVPLGVGLAVAGAPQERAVLAGCIVSVLIEVTQLFFISGRAGNLTDVVANTVGGALGFVLARHWKSIIHPELRSARRLASLWAAIWLAIQITSSFGFALSLPDSVYYGQIGRALPRLAAFPGVVISATIDTNEVSNARLANSGEVKRAILSGAPVTTTVVPRGATSTIAPILRLADVTKKEIVLLGQQADDLVFGARTGASLLRLRQPLFSLPAVFARHSPSSVDTMMLSGRYHQHDVMLRSVRGAVEERRISRAASMGWTLWLPFQWMIEGSRLEKMISWIWLGTLTMPLGYWTGRADRSRGARILPSSPWGVASLGLMVAGLIIAPLSWGLPPASLGDWVAALGGFLLGSSLYSRAIRRELRASSAGA